MDFISSHKECSLLNDNIHFEFLDTRKDATILERRIENSKKS